MGIADRCLNLIIYPASNYIWCLKQHGYSNGAFILHIYVQVYTSLFEVLELLRFYEMKQLIVYSV